MKKRPITLAIAVGAALTLAACSGNPAPPAQTGPVDLTMAVWTSNADHLKLFKSIAAEYVAKHPDEVSSVTFDTLSGEYLTSLTTQIAGSDGPDLAWIPESSGKEFVDSGALYDLSPALKKAPGYKLDDIIPSSLERWSKDGDVFAYPFSNSPFGIYINRNLIDQAGQPQPADLLASGKWTWDSAVEIASKTAAAAHTGPIVYAPNNVPDQVWDNLTAVWASFGAAPWSKDGTTCTFTSPEMIKALTWYNRATYSRGGFAKAGETYDFASGSAAMMVAQLSSSGSIDPSIKWDFLPLPSGPRRQVSVVGQAGIGVLAKGQNPKAAADFLAFFTDPDNSAKLATFFPPPRESLLKVATLHAAAPALSTDDIQSTIIDAVPHAVIKSASGQYSQVSPIIQTGFDGLWRPNADVKAVTKDICDQISPILAK